MQRISVSDVKDVKTAVLYKVGYDIKLYELIHAMAPSEQEGKQVVAVKDGILIPTSGSTHAIPLQVGRYEMRYPSGRVVHFWVN